MKKVLLVSLLVFAFVPSVVLAQMANKPAVVAPETKELAIRLLEANGVRESIIRIFEDIISRAPADQKENLREILKSDAIIENIVPIYAKHFTPVELKELISFYKSPVGSKNLALTPVLMTEVMQTTEKYFEDRMNQLQKMPQDKSKP